MVSKIQFQYQKRSLMRSIYFKQNTPITKCNEIVGVLLDGQGYCSNLIELLMLSRSTYHLLKSVTDL